MLKKDKTPIDILHHAAEVVNIAILQLDLEIKRLAHSSSPGHSGKIDGGYGVKLDVDGRFVNEDESLVERIEITRSSATGTRDSTLVVVAMCLRERGEREGEREGRRERGREYMCASEYKTTHNSLIIQMFARMGDGEESRLIPSFNVVSL